MITIEGVVETTAFLPDKRTGDVRADGAQEVSVNWEDSDAVLAFTLAKRDQSAHGVARLPRTRIDDATREQLPGAVRCERARLETNVYHGNLVYRGDLSNPVKKMIAAALALGSTLIRRPDDTQGRTAEGSGEPG